VATITHKRRVLSVAGKLQVIWYTENGKKKSYVCREFGLANATIETI